jgi:putative ABC transport system permease protein
MFEIIKSALAELTANKGRTILTALGIAIGVMSVSLIFSTGQVAQSYISGYLTKSIGKPTTITINADFNSRADTAKIAAADYKFFQSIKSKYPIESESPVAGYQAQTKNLFDETIGQQVRGVGINYQQIAGNKNVQTVEGRFFNESEYQTGENVALVTKQFAKDVKGKSSLLGERIEFGKTSFKVIGEYEGETSLTANEKEVIVPLPTLWKLRGAKEQNIQQILYAVQSEDQIDYVSKALLEEINVYRASTFSGDFARKLSTASSKSALETINGVIIAFQAFLALVAVISLVVGGIGVLNVMLMAVAQRIKEIGIRKAFGAKNRDILILFLSESITLTALSGLFGAMLAQYFVILIVKGANYINPDLALVSDYSWFGVYIAFILSCLIGVGFGIYPAYKAGKLSVVDALRYD